MHKIMVVHDTSVCIKNYSQLFKLILNFGTAASRGRLHGEKG